MDKYYDNFLSIKLGLFSQVNNKHHNHQIHGIYQLNKKIIYPLATTGTIKNTE